MADCLHEITAFYAGGTGLIYYLPVLECSCGFSSGRCDSWEEAGSSLDQHLLGQNLLQDEI